MCGEIWSSLPMDWQLRWQDELSVFFWVYCFISYHACLRCRINSSKFHSFCLDENNIYPGSQHIHQSLNNPINRLCICFAVSPHLLCIPQHHHQRVLQVNLEDICRQFKLKVHSILSQEQLSQKHSESVKPSYFN